MIKKVFSWLSRDSKKKSSSTKVGGAIGKLPPEAVCELDLEKMDRETIKAQLAKLYKRHNHAAGSLDSELREEAEQMLDAIAHCREKYVDAAVRGKK